MSAVPEMQDQYLALRAEVRVIEERGWQRNRAWLPFHIMEMDRKLAGNGLAVAALHEITSQASSAGDEAAAILFAAGIAARLSAGGGAVLWALRRQDLFAPGLEQAGLASDRLILAECGRDEDVLAAVEEGLDHGGLAAVVGEASRIAMVSTRRLQLAAERSGTMALLLRRWRRTGEDSLAPPSAARTRWRIGCVPSAKLPAPGIARPRWRIELVRQRGGEPFTWIMEGTDAEGRLAVPAEPGHRSAAADRGAGRQAA